MGWVTKSIDDEMNILRAEIERYADFFKTLAEELTELVEDCCDSIKDFNKAFEKKNVLKYLINKYGYISHFKRGLPYHRRIYIN